VAAGAVAFQGRLSFEGVEDRFDPLAQPQQSALGWGGLVIAGNPFGAGRTGFRSSVIYQHARKQVIEPFDP
jgi:hypothetical protein